MTSTIESSAVVESEVALRKIDNAMSKFIYITLLTQADKGNLNIPADIELTEAEKSGRRLYRRGRYLLGVLGHVEAESGAS